MKNFKLSATGLSVLGLLAATSPSNAQEIAKDKDRKFEEIIVTGTAGGTGQSQLDSSFSISSLDAEDIERFAPKGTADLLKTIPGVWAESSGGVSGANIFVRGLPSTGDADFVSIALQGVPIYGASTLSFFEQSSIFRVDETIERLEGLRGGANTIFSNGQAGLTTNFILKEGSDEPEGLVKATVGDYDLLRVDAVHSGPLAGGWNYMVGGYFSESNGVRDADFKSEEGKQLTINLTKELDEGKISVYNRYTDDHGQWYLPIPLNVDDVGDIGTFTQLTSENRVQTLDIHPTKRSGSTLDLGDGRGWKGNVFGVNFDKSFGNITINNRFNYTSGNANTFGLVPAGQVSTAASGDIALADGTSLVGLPVSDGSIVAADDFLESYGSWIVEKELDAIVNDFTFTVALGSHELSAGFYYTDFSSDDVWSLGNNRAFVIGGGRVEADCTALGNCGAFALVQNGDATQKALYLHDKWQINDRFTFDLGVRKTDHKASIDLATASTTGTAVPFGITLSSFVKTKVDQDETSFTTGLNYNINDSMSVFVRLNEGYDFSYFNDLRDGAGSPSSLEPQELSQKEIGFKWQGDSAHVYLTLFDSNLKGAPIFQQTATGPVNLGAAENEASGVEIDADYQVGGFAINMNTTLQSTEQINSSVPTDIGNSAQRLPDMQFRLSPSYSFNIGDKIEASVYGGVSYVDERFSDNANAQKLPSYTKLDLGAVVNYGDTWECRIAIDNANDEEGFTEGNPLVFGSTTTARPILGRNVRLSVQYQI